MLNIYHDIQRMTFRQALRDVKKAGPTESGLWPDGSGGLCEDPKEAARRLMDEHNAIANQWQKLYDRLAR